MKNNIRILAIESSCDETAAAVIEEIDGKPVVLSNIISSQVDLHALTGGVVPEVASRAHVEAIVPVITESLVNSKSQTPNTKEISCSNSLNIKNSNLGIVSDLDISASDLLNGVTHIAVTAGPGLIGSLLVGFNAAKTISYALNLPIVPVNHIEGHIYSALAGANPKSQTPNTKEISSSNSLNIKNSNLDIVSDLELSASYFPLISLTVSGGHTSITLMEDHGVYETLGETLDDAVGEAYDKVAKLLGLGYPGGPIVSKYASEFRNKILNPKSETRNKSQNQNSKSERNPKEIHNSLFIIHNLSIVFPRPLLRDDTFNFSFSGLKTAVLYQVKKIILEKDLASSAEISTEIKQEICCAFEDAVAEVLSSKLSKAIAKYSPKTVVFAGGVSANSYLRGRLGETVTSASPSITFLSPERAMTGDNAAMIGLAAYYHIKRGDVKKWDEIKVDSNWELVE
ncbi:MAG: tRNA (adenosine(37)-N6)-threonylcarbamoyltransferase complex transferase subunit TsaD [Candidatus Berkelbacteria bacterium]